MKLNYRIDYTYDNWQYLGINITTYLQTRREHNHLRWLTTVWEHIQYTNAEMFQGPDGGVQHRIPKSCWMRYSVFSDHMSTLERILKQCFTHSFTPYSLLVTLDSLVESDTDCSQRSDSHIPSVLHFWCYGETQPKQQNSEVQEKQGILQRPSAPMWLGRECPWQ